MLRRHLPNNIAFNPRHGKMTALQKALSQCLHLREKREEARRPLPEEAKTNTTPLRDVKVSANSNPIFKGNIYNDVMVLVTPLHLFHFKSTHLGC